MDVAECCDFCLTPAVAYVHLTDRFVIVGDTEAPTYVDTDGQWAACPTCHYFIVSGEPEALAEASVTTVLLNPRPGYALNELFHRRVVAGFWANYHGSWKAYTPS